MARRDVCAHSWIERKTEYQVGEFGDRIEEEKYCERCGEGKYHRYVEYNGKERMAKVSETLPEGWSRLLD